VICPGDDLATLFPDRIAAYGVTRCKLHMMRLADPGYRLGSAVMSDLGLARYAGYAALPPAEHLRRRLERDQREALENGVHLIVVRRPDGTADVQHDAAVLRDERVPRRVRVGCGPRIEEVREGGRELDHRKTIVGHGEWGVRGSRDAPLSPRCRTRTRRQPCHNVSGLREH